MKGPRFQNIAPLTPLGEDLKQAVPHLTHCEANTLAALYAGGGNLVSHRELIRSVWGTENNMPTYDEYPVRTYVKRIRKKVGLTVPCAWTKGYYLAAEDVEKIFTLIQQYQPASTEKST